MAKFNYPVDGKPTPLGPSAWEKFLLGAGVSESTCASVLAGPSPKGRAIRSWVQEHYATKYVPERVIQALGLQEKLKIRWPGAE